MLLFSWEITQPNLNLRTFYDTELNSEGEGPSRGLLRAYEPSDGTFSSTTEYAEQLPELYLLPLASPPAPAADPIAVIFNSITGHGLHNINSNLETFSMSLFGVRALASGNNC